MIDRLRPRALSLPRSAAGLPAAPLLACLFLAACAVPADQPPPGSTADLRTEPGLPLALPLEGTEAKALLERVAAGCWLDGVVGGGSMIVNRQTGRIVITSETEDLLIADLVPQDEGSIVRLTGPAAHDPQTAVRLSETLQRGVETGETGCPPLTG